MKKVIVIFAILSSVFFLFKQNTVNLYNKEYRDPLGISVTAVSYFVYGKINKDPSLIKKALTIVDIIKEYPYISSYAGNKNNEIKIQNFLFNLNKKQLNELISSQDILKNTFHIEFKD